MSKILERNIYKNDYELFLNWFKNPIIRYKIKNILNANKILKKNSKNIQTIVSDNIRIGIIYTEKKKKYYFINPTYYALDYLNSKFLKKIYGKNFEDVRDYYKKIEKKVNTKNIIFKTQKKQTQLNKKILFLGPAKRNLKIINLLKKNKYKVEITNKSINKSYFFNKKINFIISSGYPFKIKPEIIKKFKNKIFNLHATFLPWGKGIGTTFFSFLLNQPTGASIHVIDHSFDTGDLIIRKYLKANQKDTTRTFYAKLLNTTEKISLKYLPFILSNKVKFHPQNKFIENPPYFSRFEFEKVIQILPSGYDTNIKQLIVLNKILKNNMVFLKKMKFVIKSVY